MKWFMEFREKIVLLKEGDLVKIDVCASWQGYCADMARCFFVGSTSADCKKLVDVAASALNKGIEKAIVGQSAFRYFCCNSERS